MSQYKIANLHLNFGNIEYDYFQKRMADYIIHGENCEINISYSENENIILPKGRQFNILHKWNWIETEDNKYAAFQKHPYTKKNVSLIECDKNWENISLQLCNFENDLGITLGIRSFIAAGEIFAYSLLKHDGFVLHSSAINYNGNGILFSAPSGTGKSTHTGLWKKYYNAEIINDDTPAIRFVNGIPFLFGTPWSGKTKINCNYSVPVKAIIFINRSENNNITQINGSKAFSLMINETRKSFFSEMAQEYIEIINKLICSVPIYVLSCNISKEAVDVVKNALKL